MSGRCSSLRLPSKPNKLSTLVLIPRCVAFGVPSAFPGIVTSPRVHVSSAVIERHPTSPLAIPGTNSSLLCDDDAAVCSSSPSVCFNIKRMAPKCVRRSGAGRQGIESASFPQTALGRMASGMPAAFPGAPGSPLQGAGGSRLGSSGGAPLGRYDSVLNNGLFKSLQVSCAVILLMFSSLHATNPYISSGPGSHTPQQPL